MAVASWRGTSRGMKLRDAGEQFLSVARYARTQAAAEARVFRLNVDAQNRTYQLTAQDGQDFVSLGTEFGRTFSLPEGFNIAMTDAQQAPLGSIEFFPNGRTQPAHVRLTSDDNYTVDLDCPSSAEGFGLVVSAAQGATR